MKLTRRNGMIAALASVLPALGQTKNEYKLSDAIENIHPAFLSVQFTNKDKQVSIGWDLETMELVVKADGREARVSQKEVLDALGAK